MAYAITTDRRRRLGIGGWSTSAPSLGLTSVILVMLMGQSRVFYSMSRDGLVPASVHPTCTRSTARRTSSTIFTGVRRRSPPVRSRSTSSAELVSIGTLFAFVLVCIGVLILRMTRPDLAAPVPDAVGAIRADHGNPLLHRPHGDAAG